MTIVFHTANNLPVGQRQDDGYLNATAMCKAQKRKIAEWLRLGSTLELVAALAKNLNESLILKGDKYFGLIEVKRGSPTQGGGVWIHPELAPHLEKWCKTPKRKDGTAFEAAIADKLKKRLGGYREVLTPAGKVDLLTDTEIIEVKESGGWKEAVGQVLVYGQDFPDRRKRIHLFGNVSASYISMIRQYCTPLGIEVTWE